MSKTIRIIIVLALFFCGWSSISATIMSESLIKDLAQVIERQGNGRFECHAEHRTLVFDVYLMDNSYLPEFDKDKIVNNVKEEMAMICSINFISVRYNIHYFDDAGNKHTNQVSLGMSDILNLKGDTKEIFTTKNHPKAHGVNLTMSKPEGWNAREGNGPHIVKKFEAIHGDNYASYMIQINEAPTFISKQEAKEIFRGNEKYGVNLQKLQQQLIAQQLNAQIKSCSEDVVGNYPACRVEYTCHVEQSGITANLYGVAWIVLYEDMVITLYGSANTNDAKEMSLFAKLFALLTNNVHFYDQYID